MKKIYTEPSAEIMVFSAERIVTNSAATASVAKEIAGGGITVDGETVTNAESLVKINF